MEYFELLYYADLFVAGDLDPFATMWISMVVAGALFLVIYVMEAIALWTISGREGYKHRWMAFIPFFNSYYIGVLSEKNKFYNMPAKRISLALAIVEFLLVCGFIFYYSVAGIVYAGNLYESVIQTVPLTGQSVVVGYKASSRIAGTWIAWVFDYLDVYVLDWVNIIYILLNVLVVITFFQTYACRRYFLFSIIAVIFPVKGVLMFAVRNNRGMNYRDFVRGEQRRRYEMYQQYYNQNGNPYGGYNPYSGRPTPPPSDNPYSSRPSSPAEDPFDGLGEQSGSSSSSGDGAKNTPENGDGGDPFDEFKN